MRGVKKIIFPVRPAALTSANSLCYDQPKQTFHKHREEKRAKRFLQTSGLFMIYASCKQCSIL